MPNVLADKRHRDLNIHLSDILHQYLLAVDVLHDNPLADITDNLSRIQTAILECHRIMVIYKCDHERSDE